MKAAITAIGTANPIYKQHQKAAADLVANVLDLPLYEKRLLKAIYQSTGIEYRHSVLSDFCKQPGSYEFFPNDVNAAFPTTADRMRVYKENALKLALSAIKDCLTPLKHFDANTITHLITVSCTGMYAPGIDIEIVKHMQLRSHVKRTMINFMGCYGSFNAIKVADAICKAEPNAKVLVVSVELCTIHFQKNASIDNIFSNAIFADGAASLLIEAKPKDHQHFSLEGFYCDLLPEYSDAMAWHIADHGFDIVLSSYVPQAIQSGIAEFADRFMQREAMVLSDIDIYAIHPGGYKILKACEKALSLHESCNQYSYRVLRDYGNMSSATVLFVLKAIWEDMTNHHINQKIFSCAFGPGLTLEAMFLQVGPFSV